MAEYLFKNMKQVNRYLEKQAKIGLEYCAYRAETKLKELLKKRVYEFEPEIYERTFELLNSISKSEVIKVHNSYYVEIYYDTDKIRSYPRDYPLWGQHTDFSGNDVSYWIPKFIEEGTDNKYYSHKGTNSIEDCKDWIKKEYNRLFRLVIKAELG